MDSIRRDFMRGLTVAGTAGLLGVWPETASAETPPETNTIRIAKSGAICVAPQFVADEFLRGEGFADIQIVPSSPGMPAIKTVALAKADLNMSTAGQLVTVIDAGDPVVILAGIHVGCYELFGTNRIRSVSDLKGNTVGVDSLGSGHYFILATMLAHVGLHPRTDVTVVAQAFGESMQQLAAGKIDALVAFPPENQELRARKIGHVIVSTILDRPWSQYFCCLLFSNKDFVRKHPTATKRALRAILKATDFCALQPEMAAQVLVDGRFTPRLDYALQTIKSIPYDRWRIYNPEDTIRFYALRLHEAGVIKSSPQKIIAQGTDWRFLNELKKELKG